MKAFAFYFLFENINNENKFEIKPATSHERIQKNKKADLLVQLILASVKVIKNVVVKFCNTVIRYFLF